MTQAATKRIREIEKIKTTIEEAFTFEAKTESEERGWLKSWFDEKVGKKDFAETAYLLSFHDDGVVWGIMENGSLRTSDELRDAAAQSYPSPDFRSETLQECRLFNKAGELLVWRVGEKQFKARWAIDDERAPDDEKNDEYFDEAQVLHGTKAENGNENFTVVADGSEGLHHAFPTKVADEEFKVKDDKGKFLKNEKGEEIRKRPLRLCVRHYLDYDQDGCAYIWLSRLVNVEVE